MWDFTICFIIDKSKTHFGLILVRETKRVIQRSEKDRVSEREREREEKKYE